MLNLILSFVLWFWVTFMVCCAYDIFVFHSIKSIRQNIYLSVLVCISLYLATDSHIFHMTGSLARFLCTGIIFAVLYITTMLFYNKLLKKYFEKGEDKRCEK